MAADVAGSSPAGASLGSRRSSALRNRAFSSPSSGSTSGGGIVAYWAYKSACSILLNRLASHKSLVVRPLLHLSVSGDVERDGKRLQGLTVCADSVYCGDKPISRGIPK